MKKSKKLLAIILVTVFALSCSFSTVTAENYKNHWAKDAIDFVVENRFWTETGDFQPDKAITRAEFSALLTRTLKAVVLDIIPPFDDVNENTPYANEIYSAYKMGLIKGDGENFYPNNTLTRQEAAAILDRAYNIINGENKEGEIVETRFTDFNEIDEWAQQYVFNVLKGGLMNGVSAKKFNPQGTLTRAECATISQRMSEMKKLDTLDFTVRDAGDDEEKNFPVLNYGKTNSIRGVSGWAVLARFEKGPGEIYFSRQTTYTTTLSAGMAWEPTPLAKVLDPDGNMIAVVELSIKDGTMKKIVSVPCEKPGIYTFQVMNGRDGDKFEIGIKEPVSWGIRAEKILTDSSVPNEGYMYTQRTVEYAFIGLTNTQPVSLYDLEDNLLGTSKACSRSFIKHELVLDNKVAPNTVYKVKFADNFTGGFLTDGIPGLISPTPEMAEDLKGGWFDEDGVVTQGPLQMRARKKAVEIAKTQNLEVVVDRPAEVPTDIQNPMAEAQLFSAYGPISGIGAAIKRQIIDPESRHLGYIKSATEYKNGTEPGVTFEACKFRSITVWDGAAGALSIPLELNYLYGNKALANRLALSMLHFATAMGEDYEDRDNQMTTHYDSMVSMFAYDMLIEAFRDCEQFIDQETREILYQVVIAMGNKMMDYPGQGVTNQGLFHPLNNMRLYNYLGCDPNYEYLHNAYKRQMPMLMRIDVYGENINYHSGYGIYDGHFIENGWDSSYEYMNREEWSENYLEYRRCKNKDQKLMDAMTQRTEEVLEFETYFHTPQPTGGVHCSNAWTARTDVEFGNGNNPGYEKLFHIFPMAAKRMFDHAEPTLSRMKTYCHTLNTVESAWKLINECYPAYENYYEPESGRAGRSWPIDTYDAFNSGVVADYSDIVYPCYQENGVKFQGEDVLAVKHNGLYFIICYQQPNALAPGNLWKSTYSYVGGAPVVIWGENTGTVGRSKKVKNAGHFESEDSMYIAALYGKLNGKFYYSGREGQPHYGQTEANVLKWVEEGKKFTISSLAPGTGVRLLWTYELVEDGIDLTVSATGLKGSDYLWLQLPINAEENKATIDFSAENGKLDYKYEDTGLMTYSWDSANESEFVKADSNSLGVHRLRIKMPAEGLKVHIEAVK